MICQGEIHHSIADGDPDRCPSAVFHYPQYGKTLLYQHLKDFPGVALGEFIGCLCAILTETKMHLIQKDS